MQKPCIWWPLSPDFQRICDHRYRPSRFADITFWSFRSRTLQHHLPLLGGEEGAVNSAGSLVMRPQCIVKVSFKSTTMTSNPPRPLTALIMVYDRCKITHSCSRLTEGSGLWPVPRKLDTEKLLCKRQDLFRRVAYNSSSKSLGRQEFKNLLESVCQEPSIQFISKLSFREHSLTSSSSRAFEHCEQDQYGRRLNILGPEVPHDWKGGMWIEWNIQYEKALKQIWFNITAALCEFDSRFLIESRKLGIAIAFFGSLKSRVEIEWKLRSSGTGESGNTTKNLESTVHQKIEPWEKFSRSSARCL